MRELIRHIEDLAAGAWPAAVTEPLDGWLLRYTAGVTRRANSVHPNRCRGLVPLEEKLARVEAFYARCGLPTRFQLCPASRPGDLDGVLAARGYGTAGRTRVQTAPLPVLRERARPHPEHRITLLPAFAERWYSAYCHAEQPDEHTAAVRREIVRRIAGTLAFALLEAGGEPAALGLGIAQGEWLGVFSMATDPSFRRQGAATAVLHALAGWGEEQGARNAYLQVEASNSGALALYTRLGFDTLYEYWYREEPSRQ